MLLTWEEEEMDFQLASLEKKLQEVAAEWHRLRTWQESESELLALVQAQTARVDALLARPGQIDRQIHSALLELAIIGHVQQFLLGQITPRC